jgi:diacylglycerol kinase (ATP)
MGNLEIRKRHLNNQRPVAQTFSIGARIKSFGCAFEGLSFMLKTHHNAWIHLVATVIVIVVSVLLKISIADCRWIVVAIFLVWGAEAFNTAVEYVCDMVSPERNIVVKRAKDIAAGAVLLSAVSAACIGLLTFWPYLASHF